MNAALTCTVTPDETLAVTLTGDWLLDAELPGIEPVIAQPDRAHRESLSFAFMSWQRAIRDDRFKLIEYCVDGKRHTQLFDLQSDPEELKNLAGDDAMESHLERMRRLLESEAERLNDGRSESDHARGLSETFWKTYRARIQ